MLAELVTTSLITPFKHGSIDFAALDLIIERQFQAGIRSFLVGGTVGEAPTLSTQEHIDLLEFCSRYRDKAVLVAGVGSNDTAASVKLSQLAEKLGYHAGMCIAPYYNKPTQEGLFLHYKQIHDSCHLPIMLYSVPHRVVIDFSDELIFRICSELPRVFSLKDCNGDMARPLRIKYQIGNRLVLLSGNDDQFVAFNSVGGDGCISTASNIVPQTYVQIQNYCNIGDFKSAHTLQRALVPLFQAVFAESNPIGVKYAAYLLGLCSDKLRLPLCSASEKTKQMIELSLRDIAEVAQELSSNLLEYKTNNHTLLS